ncbi:MAG: hypothetical protein ACXAC6_11465 [Candidatus Hodarchaeales archaeon]|jgi:hypothetical protein
MPYIFTTAWYPTDKSTEVAKRYFEMLEKYPTDEALGKMLVPAAVTTTKQGVKVIVVSEAKEGKLEEALTYTGNQMAMFQDIVGFEYATRVYSVVTEALAMLGMSLPE